jgi:pyruvate dehydrogenase E1 component
MEEAVDGEYQDFKSKDGAYVREKFFGKYPELLEMVAGMTDDEIWALNRGGHDPVKVYAAYSAAVRHTGQPTVILAKTIKGYGMGESGEGQNITHQQKHMAEAALAKFRDRFSLPCPTSSWPSCRSCASTTTARSWPTCGNGGRPSAGTCLPGGDGRRRR